MDFNVNSQFTFFHQQYKIYLKTLVADTAYNTNVFFFRPDLSRLFPDPSDTFESILHPDRFGYLNGDREKRSGG